MKKLFLSIVAVGLSLMANAQQTEKQMATLQHGEQTTVYYGPSAFVSAYNAAADTLDVITLSSGEFNVPSQISKSIAVYGAGFERDSITGIGKTILNSDLNLVPADGVNEDGYTIKAARRVNGIHLEGLELGRINIKDNNSTPICNLTIAKCKFPHIYFWADCKDCTIRQSLITGEPVSSGTKAENFLIANCYINGDYYGWNDLNFGKFYSTSTILIDHSILRGSRISGPFRYTNNIVSFSPNNGAICSNNIFVNTSGNPSQDENNNWYGITNAALWAAEGEDGEYSEGKDFALKYPEKYIGNDETEIGLHGGVYAWNKIPCIPRITSCTLDTKDAANGTIRVSIQAEVQTKE